jgi:hypothetical protein
MKNFLILIVVLCSVTTIQAQDVITLKNGEEIQALVQEVGLTEVKYKKQGNTDGPAYVLRKAEIFMITYANGTKDVFDADRSRTVTPIVVAPSQTQAESRTGTESVTRLPETPQNRDYPAPTPPPKKDRKVKFGLHTGLAVANVNSENYRAGGAYSDWDVSPRFGFTGGLLLEFKLSKWISIQPEFLITMKGCKREGYTTLVSTNTGSIMYRDAFEEWNINFTYLELPLYVTLNIPVGKDFIHVGGAPYFAYGIYGESRSHFSYQGRDIDDEMVDSALKYSLFSGEEKMYNPLDWGLKFFAGYAFFDMILLRAGYSFGLSTIDSEGTVSVKNNYFHFSFGIKF